MIEITSYTDVISDEQVANLIRFLPQEYEKLNCVIIIFQTLEQVKEHIKDNERFDEEDCCNILRGLDSLTRKGRTLVQKTHPNGIEVHIYGFNVSQYDPESYIYPIYHELRHVYQASTGFEMFITCMENYVDKIDDPEGCKNHKLELDADKFGREQFHRVKEAAYKMLHSS